jgi:hypothetical protein
MTRVAATVVCVLLAGCSAQQVYTGALQSQRQQCQKIDDRETRNRCIRDNSVSYDQYTAQAERVLKP